MSASARTLVIACGALAREARQAIALGRLEHVDLTCLPASLHNRPARIPAAMQARIRAARPRYRDILCLYGDCGTAGALDEVLRAEGVARIAGAHCYAFYAGDTAFDAMVEEEIGTFFLTDFLARHFERLVVAGLGLDRHPELRDAYFGHYRRLVYLAQSENDDLTRRAQEAARRLDLVFERRITGVGAIETFLTQATQAA